MNPHSDPVAHVLSELARRTPAESQRNEAERVASEIRSRFDDHPKQRRFWQSTAKRLAALCTRRAGKSDGGVHEWLAKAITIAGWRGVYVNTTRAEAEKVVWRNDLGAGWIDLLAKFGTLDESARGLAYRIGGVVAEVNLTKLTIDFSNGSQISLFGADDENALDKLRGQAKDEVWIDEAQKFPYLRKLVLSVVGPLLKDKEGLIRLTGTPSVDCAGYFYDVTGEDALPGWEVHRWSVVDNPHFGATESERWDKTAGEALTENGWDGTEPDFLREWLGQWVKTDARYVYPIHGVPKHVLVYAPQRLTENPIDRSHAPWLDVDAALADLPRGPIRPYEWMFGIGADFGYAQTPFAVAVWAFTFERPDIFEVFSWKQHKVLPDDQRQYLELLFRALPNVVAFAGDPAGQKAADLEAWRTRFNIPIEDADKSAKHTWQALMGGDIRKGNVHYREGSPLLHEATHLVYLPTKPGKTPKDDEFRRIADGSVPGNDCCFVAGTLVAVPGGVAPIETLHPGDLVVTRHGIRRVLDAAPTRVAPTFALTLENGMAIRGTGDHPILTIDGWIPLQSLTRDSMVIACQSLELANEDRQSSPSSTASGTGAIPSLQSEVIASITSESGRKTESRITSLFIEPSGNQCMARHPRAFTFTIVTAIRSTMRSITSSCSKAASICASTWKRLTASVQRGLVLSWPSQPLLSGIGQQRAALGTWSMGARPWRSDHSTTASASSAIRTSAARTRRQKFAACDVMPDADAIPASMTSTERAPTAARCSESTSTVTQSVVPVRVRAIVSSGLVEQTYNLTVDGEHEYIANGVVVHNCDSALYAYRYLQHHLYRDKPKDTRSPAQKQAAEYEEQVRKMGEIQRRMSDDLEYGSYASEYDWE